MKVDTIKDAVEVLENGGVIVYPTDTVYGLGADIANLDAVHRVREIKQRVDEKPILALVADMVMLEEYALLTPIARSLAETFLPGPLSLILTARDNRLSSVAGKEGAVGFRMPNKALCRELVAGLGRPITSTSINKAGEAQPLTLPLMLVQIGIQRDLISYIIDEGELPMSHPSTVLDVRGEKAVMLREGAISADALHCFL